MSYYYCNSLSVFMVPTPKYRQYAAPTLTDTNSAHRLSKERTATNVITLSRNTNDETVVAWGEGRGEGEKKKKGM
jgi:hypothetical protein